MTPTKIDYNATARHFGLSWRGHELWLLPHKLTFSRSINARAAENIAACAAVGLSYWCDGAGPSVVWGLHPETREFHSVTLDRRNRRATGRGFHNRSFAPADNPIDLFTQIDPTAKEIPDMTEIKIPKPTAADHLRDKARNERNSARSTAESEARILAEVVRLQSDHIRHPSLSTAETGESMAVSLIRLNPDCITGLHTDYLVAARGKTPHDDKISNELRKRGLTSAGAKRKVPVK